jgi:hypothetical protein
MLAAALKELPELPPVVPIPDTVRQYLQSMAVPEDIVADLEASCHAEWLRAGRVTLVPVPLLAEQNGALAEVGMPPGLIALAAGANGDPITLECSTRRMFYLSFELLCDGVEGRADCVVSTPYLYDDFWMAAVTKDDFPWDSYDAQRQWG